MGYGHVNLPGISRSELNDVAESATAAAAAAESAATVANSAATAAGNAATAAKNAQDTANSAATTANKALAAATKIKMYTDRTVPTSEFPNAPSVMIFFTVKFTGSAAGIGGSSNVDYNSGMECIIVPAGSESGRADMVTGHLISAPSTTQTIHANTCSVSASRSKSSGSWSYYLSASNDGTVSVRGIIAFE